MICTKCNQDKTEDQFFSRSDRPKGFVSFCKTCFKDIRTARYKSETRMYRLWF